MVAAVAKSGTAIAEVDAKGAGSQALVLVDRAKAAFAEMPSKRRTRLLALGMVLVAVISALGWWGTRTEWKTLYSGMEERDVQQVEAELAAASIPYQSTADGLGVQVPAEMLDKARVEIATKGMPQSGRMGFELFDKPNWVGSEFDEKVNYQRALEGELEHTIATIGAVRSARVHLVLPKDSLFTQEKEAAKASVVLKLKKAGMAREEVESIRNLIAGAVEGLNPEQVTLVDADGRMNFNTNGPNAAASYEEQALEQKLVTMLEPLAGRDNVRATVNLVYDQSSEEKTDEVVDPTQVVALTTQKIDQVSGAAVKAGGIPGTVSNTPAAAAVGTAVSAVQAAKEALPVYPAASPMGQTQHEENSTFAVSKHVTHVEQGPGRILRVTAAVLVNDRGVMGTGKDPQMVWKPRTPEEIKRLGELAQAAVGFDGKRGDSVVMENISFTDNVPEPKVVGMDAAMEEAKSLLRSQPEMLRDIGAGVLAVLVMLMVVRPVTQQTIALLKEPKQLGNGLEVRAALPSGSPEHAWLGEGAIQPGVSTKWNGLQQGGRVVIDEAAVLEKVTTHIRKQPMQSTRLLEAWIGGEEK